MDYRSRYVKQAVSLWCTLLVISLIMGYAIYNAFSSRIYANVFESMNNNMDFAESSYDIFMSQMKMGMLQASVEPSIKNLIQEKDGAALDKLVRDWGNHRYYVSEWYVLGNDGSIISYWGKAKEMLLQSGGRTKIQPIVQDVLAEGTAVMGTELVASDGTGSDFILMQFVVVPVMGRENEPIGCIVTAMNLNKDNNIAEKILDDTGMDSIITAGDKVIASSVESDRYRLGIGSSLPEDISKEVLVKGQPYISSLGAFSGSRDRNLYNSAFRPVKNIKGEVIGSQGIINYDSLAETSLKQIKDFAIIVVILLVAVFSLITWFYVRTQKALMSEKQFSNRLGLLKKFSDLVRQAVNEDEVYEILFGVLKKNVNISQVLVIRKEIEGKQLRAYKAMDESKLESLKTISVGEEKCWAVRTGKEFVYNGKAVDYNCTDYHGDSESYLCLPIMLGGIVSGVIQIQSSIKNYFTEEIISELRIYVDTITPVISNLRLLESLNNMASIDTLTKVYNRRYMERYMSEHMALSMRNNLYMSVIMLDIDFFKRFNDTYGHDAGDYVLMHFADTLKSNVRESDVVARYGGEEFVIILPQTDLKGAYSVAEKIRTKVEDMSLAAISSENPPKITCSLGISCFPLHGSNIDKLIQSADKALYQAKNSGRNNTCIFGGEQKAEAVEQ